MSKVKDPQLWKSIKEKWHNSDKGGEAGKWNARKAQLAVKEYKSRGGKYIGKKDPNNSLTLWTKEDWGYIDGKEGNRYLPKNVRENLTIKEKMIENKRKKKSTNENQPRAEYLPSTLAKIKKNRQKILQENAKQPKKKQK